MEKTRKNKGITLVALVITIIILLILAGISIQAIENTKILKNAKLAKDKYIDDSKKEDNDINKITEYINSNRENNTKESELIEEVTFKIIEIKGMSIKIQINVKSASENNARGYFIYLNGEVVAVKEEKIIEVSNLKLNTEYTIKCGVIDKSGNIKESLEDKVKTLEKEVIYDGIDSSNFELFRVDDSNAKNYPAYGQEKNFFYIYGHNLNGRTGINVKNKIDLTNINKIEINIGSYNNYGSDFYGTVYLGIYTKKDNTLNFSKMVKYSTNTTSLENKILELDVSEVTGEYYIKIISEHPNNVQYYSFYTHLYYIQLK